MLCLCLFVVRVLALRLVVVWLVSFLFLNWCLFLMCVSCVVVLLVADAGLVCWVFVFVVCSCCVCVVSVIVFVWYVSGSVFVVAGYVCSVCVVLVLCFVLCV